MAQRGQAGGAHVVGGLDRVDWRARRRRRCRARAPRQQGLSITRGVPGQLRACKLVIAASPRSCDTRLASIATRTMRVRVEGSGPPLLLLNGLTRPLESWEPFVAALSERTVVTFDAPGIGESPEPIVPLTIKMLATVAQSVLDEVGFDCVDVLGISHGGAVAQQFAVSYPARLNKLVL